MTTVLDHNNNDTTYIRHVRRGGGRLVPAAPAYGWRQIYIICLFWSTAGCAGAFCLFL